MGVNVYPTENGYILHQDEIIDKLEKTFKGDVATVRNCSTPMSPQYTIIRPKDETDKISAVDQQKYRSGVGSLNYLVKHTRPDLSNSVRESLQFSTRVI